MLTQHMEPPRAEEQRLSGVVRCCANFLQLLYSYLFASYFGWRGFSCLKCIICFVFSRLKISTKDNIELIRSVIDDVIDRSPHLPGLFMDFHAAESNLVTALSKSLSEFNIAREAEFMSNIAALGFV